MTDFARLRREEFGRLDDEEHIYLDYTGSGLYPDSLVRKQNDLLRNHVLGNPHSTNPASKRSTKLVEDTRRQILDFFNASSDTYCTIFTANATAAMKLVAESFPFSPSSTFALLKDNHNSVQGIRQYAKKAGATLLYIPVRSDLRAAHVQHYLHHHAGRGPNLFAYPAQSNFSGVKHSLSYVRCAQQHNWHVLLDVAAFVPTNPLDLCAVQPDFVALSFYKMFGLPTGVGALIAKKSAMKMLRRPWFAGGTVDFVGVATPTHELHSGPTGFEDGTGNFLDIAVVSEGLRLLSRVGMENILNHVADLTALLLDGMVQLRHDNRNPVVRIYGPTDLRRRGGTVAFDILTREGVRVAPEDVESAANERTISLRTGCFCNPGAAEKAIHRDRDRERECMKELDGEKLSMATLSKCVGEALGCVRVSLGIASSSRDVQRFLSFLQDLACQLPRR